MKNDTWTARPPNYYQNLFQIPQEAIVDVLVLSFGCLNEPQMMFVAAPAAAEILCLLKRQRKKC